MAENIYRDKVTGKTVRVIEQTGKKAKNYMTGQYDWEKNEMSVADFDTNSDFSEDSNVVICVFEDSIDNNSQKKEYPFPEDRLEKVEEAEESDNGES